MCLSQTACKMNKNCKTCKRKITQNEKTYHCIGCNCIVHLEPSCDGLSNVAINGMKNSGYVACYYSTLVLKTTNATTIIQNWTIHKANEQVEALKIEDKLESVEVKLTSLIGRKVEEVLKVYCKEIQNSYCEIAA